MDGCWFWRYVVCSVDAPRSSSVYRLQACGAVEYGRPRPAGNRWGGGDVVVARSTKVQSYALPIVIVRDVAHCACMKWWSIALTFGVGSVFFFFLLNRFSPTWKRPGILRVHFFRLEMLLLLCPTFSVTNYLELVGETNRSMYVWAAKYLFPNICFQIFVFHQECIYYIIRVCVYYIYPFSADEYSY